MKTYPIYRKYVTGEFEKICSPELVILVGNASSGNFIWSFKSEMMVTACIEAGETTTQPATRDEFEKAYGEAFFYFQKANTIL